MPANDLSEGLASIRRHFGASVEADAASVAIYQPLGRWESDSKTVMQFYYDRKASKPTSPMIFKPL